MVFRSILTSKIATIVLHKKHIKSILFVEKYFLLCKFCKKF